jgi:hypothetical protein
VDPSQQVRRDGNVSATQSSSQSTVPACPFRVTSPTTQWGLAKRSWLLKFVNHSRKQSTSASGSHALHCKE